MLHIPWGALSDRGNESYIVMISQMIEGFSMGVRISKLRGAITPTPRQQGVEELNSSPPSPYWSWARLLKRIFAVDMARCPVCQQGTLRIIAAITQGHVIKKILGHLQLGSEPPPIAPARQTAFAWAFSSP